MARGLAVAAALVACLIAATPAGATHSVSVDCAGLQAALDGVDDDATITLLAGEVCTDAYILPSFAPPTISYTTWTLQGGAGAGFDGSALTGAERMLSGDDSHWVTIQNLTSETAT